MCPIRQSNHFKVSHSDGISRLSPYALVVQWKSNILGSILETQQIERLKNEADFAASDVGCGSFGNLTYLSSIQYIRALIVTIKDANYIE